MLVQREQLIQKLNTLDTFDPQGLEAEIFANFLLYLAEHLDYQERRLQIHQLLRVEINVQGIWKTTRNDYRVNLIEDFTIKTGLYKEIPTKKLLHVLNRCFNRVVTMAEDGRYSSELGRFLEENKES